MGWCTNLGLLKFFLRCLSIQWPVYSKAQHVSSCFLHPEFLSGHAVSVHKCSGLWFNPSYDYSVFLGGRRRRLDRGWDGWMATLARWTWVWVNFGRWWWTGRSGVLRFMGSQRVGHDWATELSWNIQIPELIFFLLFSDIRSNQPISYLLGWQKCLKVSYT